MIGNVFVAILYMLLRIILGKNCGLGMFYRDGFCYRCPEHCDSCSSSSNCDFCADEFITLNGSCYDECVYPKYPLFHEPFSLECQEIAIKNFEEDEILIEDFNSIEQVRSIFLNGLYNQQGIELAFWIRFEDFGGLFSEEKNFLVISNNFEPYQTIHKKPYIFKLGLLNSILTGPTELCNVEQTMEVGRWYYITVVLEFETNPSSYYLFVGIVVYDFVNKVELIARKSNKYLSSLTFNEKVILHLGNLNLAENLKFLTKNLRIFGVYDQRNSGRIMVQANLTNLCNYQKNFSIELSKDSEQDLNLRMDIDFDNNFTIYLIKIKFRMLRSIFPSKFLKIFQDDVLVYSLEMVLLDATILLKINEKYKNLIWNHFDLRLMIIKLENYIIIDDSNQHIILNSSSKLTLEINSSIHATKFQGIDLMESVNPSIINIFQNYLGKNEAGTPCNILKAEHNYNCFSYVLKKCQNNPELDFYFSLDECDLKKRHSCTSSIPHCEICFNNTYCLVCKYNSYNYNGFCSTNKKYDHICFIPIHFQRYVCTKCNSADGYFEENGACKSCSDSYIECKKSNEPKKCFDYHLEKKCTIHDQEFCPPECVSCKLISGKIECKICRTKSLGYTNEENCNFCHRGYVYRDGACQFKCDKFGEIIFNGTCKKCEVLDETFVRLKCPLLCEGGEIYYNNSCLNVEMIDDCKQKGPRWCEFCSKRMMTKECHINFNSKDLAHRSNKIFERRHILNGKFPGDYYACPKNAFINHDLIDTCSKPRDYDNKENLNHQNSFILEQKPLVRKCFEYIEGFFIIFINETCIYSPNTHHFTLSENSILSKTIKITKNARIIQIKLTNKASLFGRIFLDTLYLEKCPLRFYNYLNQSCLYCSDDCLVCSGPEPSDCSFKNSVAEYFLHTYSIENIKHVLNLDFNNEYNTFGIKLAFSYSVKCPKTCKSCYFTGEKFICTACLNDEFVLSRSKEFCQCKNNYYLDHKSFKCVKNCPKEYKLKNLECLSSCLDQTYYKTDYEQYFEMEGNSCIGHCPEMTYSILNFEFDENQKCIKNEFHQKTLAFLDDQSQTSSQSIMKVLLQKGLSQIPPIDYLKHSKLLKYFHTIALETPNLIDTLIQTMTVFLSKGISMNDAIIILEFLEKLDFKSLSMNTIWKIHYLSHISRRNYFEYFNPKFISLKNIFSYGYTVIKIDEKKTISIKGPNTNYTVILATLKRAEETFSSFVIGNSNYSLEHKIKISIDGILEPDDKIYFANFTSEYMEEMEKSNTDIEIFQRCIYFIFFTKDFKNESFHALIDDDLFYGSNIVEEPLDKLEEKDQNYLSKLAIILASLIGSLAFIYLFTCFLKTKILNPSKIKFVQMTNIDSDDEDEKEKEKKEDENEDEFRYNI